MAGPFKIEGKTLTMVAKSRPSKTKSPLVANVEEPAKSKYGAVIIIIGIIALVVAGIAVYAEKAKA